MSTPRAIAMACAAGAPGCLSKKNCHTLGVITTRPSTCEVLSNVASRRRPGHRPYCVATLGLLALLLAPALAAEPALKLVVQNGYLPQSAVLVRVDVLQANGQRNWNLWDAEAILSVDQSEVTLSTNRVLLRNGLGSALVTFSGGGDFNLTATVGSLTAVRPLQTLSDAPVTVVAGTLPGSNTSWSGVILITNDLVVPSGHTLTVESNTLVLLNTPPSVPA